MTNKELHVIENYKHAEMDFDAIESISGVACIDCRDEANIKVYWLLAPNRHHNLIQEMDGLFKQSFEQGFISNNGIWLRRKVALRIAEDLNLLKKKPLSPNHGLFSEDIW